MGRSLDLLSRALLDRRIWASWSGAPWFAGPCRQGVWGAWLRSSSSTRSRPISLASLPAMDAKTNLKPVIRAFHHLAADHRGETTAQVVTARALNDDQIEELKISFAPAPAAK